MFFIQYCSRYLSTNEGSTYIAIEFSQNGINRECYNKLIKMKKTQCKYQNVLHLPSSDQQIFEQNKVKETQLNLKSIENIRQIKCFQQVGVEISSADIKKKYFPLLIIYQSTNSVVLRCKKYQDTSLNQGLVVIKISPIVLDEAQILRELKKKTANKNITQMIDQINDNLILQSYDGSLRDILIHNQILSMKFICKLMKDCLRGLNELQQIGFIHSDIKPQNILYRGKSEQQLQFFICDFGSCIKIQQQNKSSLICRQSWPYRAPQWQICKQKISSKLDVWSLGCVLFECITGDSLLPLHIQTLQQYLLAFDAYATPQQIKSRVKRFLAPSQAQLLKLVSRMLEQNANQRVGLLEIGESVQSLQQ